MSRARKWRVGGSSHQEKDKTFPYSTPLFFFPGLSAAELEKASSPRATSAGGGGAVPTECGSCLWRVCRP